MNIDLAIAELERSPDLLDHFARLQEFIQDEQRRREQFYHDLDEGTKAEFINGQVVMHSPTRVEHLDVSFFTTNLLGNFELASVVLTGFDVPVAALFDASANQRALQVLTKQA